MPNNQLLQLGILLTFIGIIAIFLSLASAAGKGNAKFSVVGFLGFIPFGFASDRKMLLIGILLTAIAATATILILRSYKA
ncbi:hypothetical protein HYU18_03130 [Candidatus Woesearchaeota archaeon]|nr:hypothetical protein [Candidatus Woesearchaeota archaeon]